MKTLLIFLCDADYLEGKQIRVIILSILCSDLDPTRGVPSLKIKHHIYLKVPKIFALFYLSDLCQFYPYKLYYQVWV